MTADLEPERKRLFPFIAYLALFFAVWVFWVLVIYPALMTLGDRSLAYALANNILRLLIWVVPVFLYLKYVDNVDPIAYLKLRDRWKLGIVVGAVVTLLNFLLSALAYGIPTFNWQVVTWNSVIGTSVLIGFVEEVPFRGFILQKLQERMSFWPANIVSSLLFLLIHFPGWVLLHIFNMRTAAAVFVIGVLMAILFRYSRSLWSSIVAHSGNDFVSFMIFHM
jgi:membrane protease YdiL (CAAX protease family)